MARDPGSVWAPLPEAGAPDGYRKTQLIFHATGGTGSARAIRDNWFGRADVVVESTFIVGKSKSDPTLQIMDSTDNADANYTANARAISVEVVCTGSEPYTEWQVAECIRIGRWAAANHPISKRICPAHDASGFGWHVMFGAPGPWTPAVGKVCPGAPAVTQLKTLIFPAIFADNPPTPEDELPTPKEVVDALLAADVSDAYEGKQSFKNVTSQVWTNSRELLKQVAGLSAAVSKLAAAVAGDDLTAAELKAAVQDAIAESVVNVDVSVSGAEQPPPAA